MTEPGLLPYERFHTGLTFAAVRRMVVAESEARYEREGQYIRASRRRILGKWRQLKLEAYAHYLHAMGARHGA